MKKRVSIFLREYSEFAGIHHASLVYKNKKDDIKDILVTFGKIMG